MSDISIKPVKHTLPLKGLTSAQASEKLKQQGENTFAKAKPTAIKTFCKQFLDPISLILIAAAGLSVFMGEYSDAAVIFSIVVMNSLLSFVQEFRSCKAIAKLSELIDRKAQVIRDGRKIFVDTGEIVVGDAVVLRAGDIVPADINIVQANNLSVNESQLTGESLSVNKSEDPSLVQKNLLFSGSVIERGYCIGTVSATGNQTKLGKIASLSKSTKKVTPHQKSLTQFSFLVLRMMGATTLLILASKIFTIHSGSELVELILFTIALAMAVLPEALPMITTINLSSGALRLARQDVIVKRLSAIEDLGRMNLLCTDKTGTLTEDQLSVAEVISADQNLFHLLACATIEDLTTKNKETHSSFDSAFLAYIPKPVQETAGYWTHLQTLPFDPTARRRRTIVKDPSTGTNYLVVLGSPETLLTLSTPETGAGYAEQITDSAKQGMRQIGIAYKQVDYAVGFDIPTHEQELNFLGFANLRDPLRKTAKQTIDKARALGVDVKILTGDSVEVAACVGREVGLLAEGDHIYSGDELALMSSSDLADALENCAIFARVTPEQKYKMIKLLKKTYVVGYQGDGINDAPSLKLADVSIAVHNATEVAKESADIVLLKDSLQVIVEGISYGRSIFANINKYIKHAMIGNIGSFFALAFFYIVFAADLPMLPIQLLIANLIQDMPLMMVFTDSVNPEEMARPQAADQMKPIMRTSMILGLFTAVYYLVYLLIIGIEANAMTRTTLFLFFNFTQLMVILCVRNKGFLWQGKKPSGALIASIFFFIALSVAMVYLPFIANLMGFAPLPLSSLAALSLSSIGFIFLLDIAKVILHKWQAKRQIIWEMRNRLQNS